MNTQMTYTKVRGLINERSAVMNTQSTSNTTPLTPEAFNYHEFNDSLAYVMRRYRVLHIQPYSYFFDER